MSDIGKSALKNLIDTAVVENETGAITGTVMNGVLQDTVDTLANGENLDAGSIKTANIADGAITTAKVANGAITEGKIGSGAVTSGKIGDGAVTAAKIGSKAVETAKLDDAAVTTAKIADGAVTADKVGAGAVTAGKIGAKAVTTAKLDDKAVTTAKVDDSAITTDKIANGNVTTAKINDGAVSADKIGSSAVTEAKIADGAVTSDKIAAGGITSAKINDGAVTTAKIADGAVSSDKLGAGAVTTTKIYDGNVTGAKMADSTITGAKIASNTIETGNIKAKAVTTAKIDDAAVDTAQIKDSAVTTDKLATSAVTTVKVNDGAVTTGKIADANVTTAKIADANVTTDKIADSNVTAAKIAANAVETAKIKDANVTTAKLDDEAVTTAKIADEAITTAKVADGAITDDKLANPVSVSQDAEAGTTTITVGEDSYDVATEPVSVSQNTSTGNVNIGVGNETTQVANVDKVNPLAKGSISSGTAVDDGPTVDFALHVRKIRLYLDSTGGGTLILYFRNTSNTTILQENGQIGWQEFTFNSDVTKVYLRNRVLTTEDINYSFYAVDSIPYIVKELLPKTERTIDVKYVNTASPNLVNPNTISTNKGLRDGVVVDATGYSVTDYIPVNEQSIKANAYKSSSWDAFVVYDENLSPLREIKNSNTYTYQAGDAFVRIMLAGTTGTALRANYGSTLNSFVEYNPIDGYLDDIKDRISEQEAYIISTNSDNEPKVQVLANAVIDSEGNVVVGASNGAHVRKMKVTPFEKFNIEYLRSIVSESSGTYFKYAWYSSFNVINAGTFISGESASAPFDVETEDVTLTPPAGALALVFSSYGTATIHKHQDTTNSMKQLYFNRNVIEKSFNHSLNEIQNGNHKIFGTAFSFKYYGISPHPSGISPYENKMDLTGLGWCYFGPFNPDVDELIHISFDVASYSASGENIKLYVAKNYASSGASMQYLGSITNAGHYDFVLDPTYYRVHKGFTDVFYVWIHKSEGSITSCIINDMKVYSIVEKLPLVNIDGANGAELMESVDANIGQIMNVIDSEDYLISPNGNRHILAVNNDGTLKTIPVIPNKAAFFGNSLMFGNTYFGMDATNINNDFYAKMNAFITSLNPSFAPAKYSAVPFETIANLADIDSVIQSTVNNLTGDEDLIIIQAGDNVTDTQATDILPTSSLALLASLKTKCPNARICWPAIWYATSDKMNAIRNACQRYGALLIPISDLNTAENQGYVGAIIDYGEGNSQTNTLSNVSAVVENTATNITVTFTYNGISYTKTIDVTSYSLDGTTLTYTGRYRISTVGAGHPGDRGMKAIANRIIYKLGMTDEENYYPLT